MLLADDAYKKCVEQLEVTRVSWEKEMVVACDAFEQAETDRLVLSRKELWVHVNYDSTTLLDRDEVQLYNIISYYYM